MQIDIKRRKIADSIINTINNLNIADNSVIIYDIDGTLIENDGRPIYPIIDTYHYATRRGLKPIIITARPGTYENVLATQKQLHFFGIVNYMSLYFIPPEKNDPAKYKLIARKNVHDRGHKAVISIGGMPWDVGQYGGIGFRV